MARVQRSRSTKIREPKAERIARRIGVPDAQIANDEFLISDVQNHSDDDQRAMNRSGEKKTVRRRSRLEKLWQANVLSKREAAACQWYHDKHEEHYVVRLRIAQWDATGGRSDRAYGHWPANDRLKPGPSEFEQARAVIPKMALSLFERVVLDGHFPKYLPITFRHTARKVLEYVETKVEL